MARKVVLHIGAMKSGTSFIQATMDANREVLAEQGVLYPGGRRRNRVGAVLDVLDRERTPAEGVGAWRRLLDEMEPWPGSAVISVELLAAAGMPKIEKILESLAPAEVHVVLTVRDLARTIPSMWQEEIQNGATWTWNEFVEGIENGDTHVKGPGHAFWRQQGTPAIARRWARAVGSENLTLITVPQAGLPPELLWTRFCSAVGIDPASCRLASRSNPSMGGASALVLRALNERLAELDLPNAKYNRFVKHGLAKKGMAVRRAQESAIGYDADWVRARSDLMIERFRELDVRILGDLAELHPTAATGVDPEGVSEREQLDAAVDALAHLIAMWSRS